MTKVKAKCPDPGCNKEWRLMIEDAEVPNAPWFRTGDNK